MSVAFGNYVLERWLAQGGMANIFLATYTGPLGFEREVVLKVILPEYAHHAGFISMFLDEARLAARLNHPNIVQVQDLGQVGGYFYIAMEYVPGPSLARALARAKKESRGISPGLSLFVVGELLEALVYAHQRRDRTGRPLGIVHRDVNPQNILLSYDGQVKLTDFGVAKANVNLHASQAGVIKGKYSHMAPEQCLAKPVDERADIFAVGILLHELLTGKFLFQRSNAYEMMRALLEEPIPLPSQVNPRAPAELDGVVMKALSRNPADRFPNSLAFLDALNLVARRLQLIEGKHELRNFLSALYRRGRNNLAGDEEPGAAVTEDRISEILKGIGGVPNRSKAASDDGVPLLDFMKPGRPESEGGRTPFPPTSWERRTPSSPGERVRSSPGDKRTPPPLPDRSGRTPAPMLERRSQISQVPVLERKSQFNQVVATAAAAAAQNGLAVTKTPAPGRAGSPSSPGIATAASSSSSLPAMERRSSLTFAPIIPVEPEKEEPTNAWGELDLDESLSSSSITLERPIEMPEESDD